MAQEYRIDEVKPIGQGGEFPYEPSGYAALIAKMEELDEDGWEVLAVLESGYPKVISRRRIE